MPQLLALAAVGAGAYLGVKWLRNKAGEFQDEFRRAMNAASEGKGQSRAKDELRDMPKLKQDPETGIYRLEE